MNERRAIASAATSMLIRYTELLYVIGDHLRSLSAARNTGCSRLEIVGLAVSASSDVLQQDRSSVAYKEWTALTSFI